MRVDEGDPAYNDGADGATAEGTSQTMRALLGLRELLLSGEFPPGTRMSELPLVERLGVSRTPLRLALAKLEHEGLLEVLHGGGYAVREFTMDEIHDAIELRGVLEGTAVRFAAERGATAEQLEQLRELSARDGPARPPLRRRLLLGATSTATAPSTRCSSRRRASPVLERALERIVALPFASPSALVQGQAELPESREILVIAQDHHRGLIEAIERREAARAEALAREHARVALRNLEIVLNNRDVLERIPGASLINLADHAKRADRGREESTGCRATDFTARSSAACCATTSSRTRWSATSEGRSTQASSRRSRRRRARRTSPFRRRRGIEVLTDGEVRRRFWFDPLTDSLSGYNPEVPAPVMFHGSGDKPEGPPPKLPAVTEKLGIRHNLPLEEYKFVSANTDRPAKATLAGMTYASVLWVPGYSDKVYPDREAYMDEVIELMKQIVGEASRRAATTSSSTRRATRTWSARRGRRTCETSGSTPRPGSAR